MMPLKFRLMFLIVVIKTLISELLFKCKQQNINNFIILLLLFKTICRKMATLKEPKMCFIGKLNSSLPTASLPTNLNVLTISVEKNTLAESF
jgi:hypothetical protein